MHLPTTLFAAALVLVFPVVGATAQQPPLPLREGQQVASILGPAPPVPPEVIARDDKGQVTIRAVRLDRPLKIDGRLDDEVYASVRAVSGFVQQEPREGEPATEQTDIWVLFDDENLYVSARCHDSHPERGVLNELRRDMGMSISQNENFVVIFDTFYDHRNGFYFQTTPLGTIRELAVTDEGNQNESWNTIWDVKSERVPGGWTTEMAIPFKSLRYRGSGPQVWGINFRRIVRWKNEISHLTRIPAIYGNVGIYRVSFAATLVGLETPAQSMNLELKPYVVASLTTDRAAAVPFDNRFDRAAGFDFKYGVTRGLIADATFNTDFAQVEEDLQQVNLTRFSLLFPEKRDFFLEGQGIYSFGGVQLTSIAGLGVGGGVGNGDVPILFFSRRIGLSQGQSVPVVAGGRLTGKVGPYGIGLLNIQTDDKASAGALATNFSAVRVKRDVLRGGNIGILATRRTPAATGLDSNLVVGVDANMLFFRRLTINSYYARSDTRDRAGNESSYRGRLDYSSDRYGLQLEHLMVGDRFNPEVGFIRRSDFRRNSVNARFSPRPRSNRLIRKLNWDAGYDYVTDARRTRVENREAQASFGINFNSSDQWNVEYVRAFEYLPQSFQIATGITVPTGGYDYQSVRTAYTLGQQRRAFGRLSVGTGSFYGDGSRRTELGYSGGRVTTGKWLNLEPGVTLNWVSLPQGRFRTRLIATRIIVTPSPRMLISSLFQYNAAAHSLSSSVRLRWEYTGGSELFLVYSDGRDTAAERTPSLLNRSFALKITRLLRF